MASATLDVVLAMESKLRTNVKSDALRWNATSQQFERFDGSAWQACVDVPSDVVHKAGAETVTGVKTFSAGIVGDLTGDVTGNCSGSSGSCTGNAATATTLATARSLQTSLASGTAASFDGSADASIGVSGVLPVANGGTGQTSLSDVTVGNATTSASCTGNSATATQATQDGAGNVIADTYLPLSGGTMTGAIHGYIDDYSPLIYAVAGQSLRIAGNSEWGDSADIILWDSANASYSGQFMIDASDGDNSARLTGTPSGSLKWAGKEVERVNSSGTNYSRYENGLQICWGSGCGTTASGVIDFSYPVAFSSTPSVLVQAQHNNSYGGYFVKLAYISTTFCRFVKYYQGSASSITDQFNYSYIAVGKWS